MLFRDNQMSCLTNLLFLLYVINSKPASVQFDVLCKQFGSRLGPITCGADHLRSKLFATQIIRYNTANFWMKTVTYCDF